MMEYVRFFGFIAVSMALFVVAKDVLLNWSKDDTVEAVKDDDTDQQQDFVQDNQPEDDLTKLDGISKDMLPLLSKAGIVTFSDLELIDEEDVKEAVETDHPDVTVSEIKLWIRQASLAQQERWAELDRLKDAMQKARAKRG